MAEQQTEFCFEAQTPGGPDTEVARRRTQRERRRAHYLANREIYLAREKRRHSENRAKANAARKARYEKNKVAHQAKCAAWRIKNRERHRATSKAWRERNRDRIAARTKDYAATNKARRNANEKARKLADDNFRIRCNLSTRLAGAVRLQGARKSSGTFKLLGCSIREFRMHIEGLFSPRMSWANYGQWHIDHIVPCAKFDLRDPEQQRLCFHWSNLRPLWGTENMAKKAKITKEHQFPLIMD